MKKLLVWDIDGTLIKVHGVGRKALNKAFYELYGINEAFNSIDMAGALDALILKQAYEIHGIRRTDHMKLFDKYIDCLEAEISKIDHSMAAPGVLKLFSILGNCDGICNTLGTGNIEQGARLKLSVDNLNRFFPVGGFGDEEMERWQVIEKAIGNSCVFFNTVFDKKNIYIIGDTPRDIECGKKLHTGSIGVATGRHTMTELEDCGADYVFENLEDTEEFLKIML